MKIACVSDIHCRWNKVQVPECDILLSSGDYSFKGESWVVEDYHKWLHKQRAKHIVSVNGNHELWVEKNYQEAKAIAEKACPRVHFINHETVEIEGLKIFGSPWTPYFFNWAWNAARTIVESAHLFKPMIGDLWKQIPEDTDILVTHGPAHGILDTATDFHTQKLISVGCQELLKTIKKLNKLKVHSFGHLHFDGGKILDRNGVKFVNAAICDDQYRPVNPVIVLDI